MRLALIIVSFAAIAVGLVHLRRAEVAVQHRIQSLQREEVLLRRELADRDVRLGELTRPAEIRRRVERSSVGLIGEDGDEPHLANRP
jgi:hypothetical protein